ncbi:MAG: hypothetical protein LBT54_06600, partial [Bifidobacteriaceae bacterium]|nr:hypothetical protein [Bifidobacteriaceae bacterium]
MIQATRPEAAPGGRVQRAGLALWSGSAGIVLLILLAVLPVPYVVEAPGPTVDALGRADGVELIQAPDAPSHPVTGQLRLTTVTTDGANRDLALGAALAGWLAADSAVIPYESVYPRAVTKRERQERAALQMSSSQEAATVAALQELGEPVGLTIASAVTDAAKAVFREGDSLLAVDGREVDGYRQLIGALEAIP